MSLDSLPRAVEILVSLWIQEEVRANKTRRKRYVVIINRMRLASVVSIVSRVLEPYKKIAFIQTLAHEILDNLLLRSQSG